MKGTLLSVVVVAFLVTMVPHAYGAESLLQTIDVESMSPPSRDPSTHGQGFDYSGRASDSRKPVLVEIGKNAKLPNPTSYYAVTHIAIEEKSDDPCRISLWGRMVDPRFRTQERKLAQFALDTCKIDKDLERALSDNKINDKELTGYGGHDNRFIRGLSVCMGGAHDPIGNATKIKGLRLRPAAVAQFESPFVEPRDDVNASYQGHCPEEGKREGKGNTDRSEYPEGWASWNMCPDGQVLTGVEVYSFDKEFRALGVRCKGVRLQQRFEAPVKDNVGY